MSADFAQSETRLNLMRAFAGESQARNRYTFAAGLARRKNLYVLESVFTFTADQERAHAKVFYNLLEQVSGQNLQVDGTYPVELFPDILDHLRSAQHNEYQEWDHDYAGFSRTAQEEGFPEIAHIFSMIAGIEKTHGDASASLLSCWSRTSCLCPMFRSSGCASTAAKSLTPPWLPPCAPSASIHRATLSAGRWRPSNNCKPHTQALTARRRRWGPGYVHEEMRMVGEGNLPVLNMAL